MHGGRGDDGRTNWDGMNTNVFFGNGGGQQRTYHFNIVAVQEVAVDTGGAMAETETGGANVNMVPREGGNRFSFYGLANYTNRTSPSKKVPRRVEDGAANRRPVVAEADLRLRHRRRRPDQAGQAVVLRHQPVVGSATTTRRTTISTSDTNPFTYTPDLSRQAYAAHVLRGQLISRDMAGGGRSTRSATRSTCSTAAAATSPLAPARSRRRRPRPTSTTVRRS